MAQKDVSTVDALKEENQRLRRAVDELSALNEIATAVSSTQTLAQVLELIIRKCVKYLQVEQAAVMLLDERKEEKPFQTMMRQGDQTSHVFPYHLDLQLTGWMLKHRQPLLINDFGQDSRFFPITGATPAIHSLLSVPLLLHGRMIGVLAVFDKKVPEGFSADDQRLLAIISAQSAQVIENARLLEEEQKLHRMQEDLRLAGEIQSNLLPRELPKIAGYEFFGKTIPAREVGGDYFDFILNGANRVAFCLGDVSGKGMPAALLMANLQAIVRSQTMLQAAPQECLEHANRLLFHCTSPEKFATLFYGHLDLAQQNLVYANAGHNQPLLFAQDQSYRNLAGGGIMLGCMDAMDYSEEKSPLRPGEILLVYSDGMSEALNEQGEEFGEKRLIEVVKKNRLMTAKEIGEAIYQSVTAHVGVAPQFDDMTIVLIKRSPA